jgi:pilus assembly protein Flp/PilA
MYLYHLIVGFLSNLFRREEGQTMAEYALLLVLIAIVVIAALLLLGDDIATVYNNIAAALTQGT